VRESAKFVKEKHRNHWHERMKQPERSLFACLCNMAMAHLTNSSSSAGTVFSPGSPILTPNACGEGQEFLALKSTWNLDPLSPSDRSLSVTLEPGTAGRGLMILGLVQLVVLRVVPECVRRETVDHGIPNGTSLYSADARIRTRAHRGKRRGLDERYVVNR
jgi:hypothetical protein